MLHIGHSWSGPCLFWLGCSMFSYRRHSKIRLIYPDIPFLFQFTCLCREGKSVFGYTGHITRSSFAALEFNYKYVLCCQTLIYCISGLFIHHLGLSFHFWMFAFSLGFIGPCFKYFNLFFQLRPKTKYNSKSFETSKFNLYKLKSQWVK